MKVTDQSIYAKSLLLYSTYIGRVIIIQGRVYNSCASERYKHNHVHGRYYVHNRIGNDQAASVLRCREYSQNAHIKNLIQNKQH
jgi:hypothetical protein